VASASSNGVSEAACESYMFHGFRTSGAVCALAGAGDFRVRGHEESLHIRGASVTDDVWPMGVEKS
jgi:hypothetical protein